MATKSFCFSVLLLLSLVHVGCSKNLDPFATPPVGMKIDVKPSLVNKMPAYMNSEDKIAATTLIKIEFLGDRSEMIDSIQITPHKGLEETIRWESILSQAKSSKCQSTHSAALSGLTDFSNLFLICDHVVAEQIRKAMLIKFNFKTGSNKQFTSWGRSLSARLDGRPLEIHQFSFWVRLIYLDLWGFTHDTGETAFIDLPFY